MIQVCSDTVVVTGISHVTQSNGPIAQAEVEASAIVRGDPDRSWTFRPEPGEPVRSAILHAANKGLRATLTISVPDLPGELQEIADLRRKLEALERKVMGGP